MPSPTITRKSKACGQPRHYKTGWLDSQPRFLQGKARGLDSSPTTRHGMAWLACQQMGIDSGHGLSLTHEIRDVSSQEWMDHSTIDWVWITRWMCSNENGCVGCIQNWVTRWCFLLDRFTPWIFIFFMVNMANRVGYLVKSPVHAGRITAGVCWKYVPPSRFQRFQIPRSNHIWLIRPL